MIRPFAALLFVSSLALTAVTGVAQNGSAGEDQKLEPWRRELLQFAFDNVSKFPLKPFHKVRARAQDEVVAACFKLEQPKLALKLNERILSWRRAIGYADYAYYCAKRGDTGRLQELVERSDAVVAEHARDEAAQQWRVDRIRVRIARALWEAKRTEELARYMSGVLERESGPLARMHGEWVHLENVDQELAQVRQILEKGEFDAAKNAMVVCVEIYRKFYGRDEVRKKVQDVLVNGRVKMPRQVRMELLLQTASVCIEKKDSETALDLVRRAQAIFDEARWNAEDFAKLSGRLATHHFRAGDRKKAEGMLSAAYARYLQELPTVVDMFRGEALRPLAEAYVAMGNGEKATMIYKRALDEAVVNPNSRPRAMDLSRTALSMALNGYEPDASLRARMVEIGKELGDPW